MRRQRQLPADQYDHLLVARTHPVEEVEVEPGVFQQRRGPCRVYERRVELVGEPAGHRNAADNAASDHKSVGTDARDVTGASTDSAPIEGGVDEAAVELTLDIEVDVPVWRPIINNFMALRILDDDPRTERLTPKKVIDRRVAHDIGILALIAVALGYLAALVSQTNTYIRTDFDLSKGEMGSVLAWIRMAGLVAFPVAWMADRVGRRPLLLWGPPAAILAVAVSGLAQNAWQFTLAQIFARGITIGLAVVLGIAAIEIVPAGSRATVTSLLAFAAGPGASTVLVLLFIADRSVSAWRWLYFIPILALVPLWMVVRKLPETPRHAALDTQRPPEMSGGDKRLLRKRMVIIGSAGFLTNVFAAPYANGINDHLRVDRGFSGPSIGLFQSITNMPYSLGVAMGGNWLERWGRRKVGGIAAFGSAIANSVQFLFKGALFWIVSAIGSFLAGPLLPALGVVGAESFPTANRGRSNGMLTIVSLAGSAVGLQVGGILADRYGFAKAMIMLAVAPILLSVVVRLWYPDGTGVELEDFNPGEVRADTPDALDTPGPNT